jgi:hypothetical protein
MKLLRRKQNCSGEGRSMKVVVRTFLSIVFALCSIFGLSQDSTPSQSQPTQSSPSEPQKESAPPPSPRPAAPTPDTDTKKTDQERKAEHNEQSQRALGVLPQFAVTSRQDAPPLTPRGKFHLFVKSAFDPVTVGIVALQAGISQADNQFPGYGQGAQGYGKRFGAALADSVDSGFWSNFAYPSLLKQDPRYFRLGEGSFSRRVIYGIKQEFVCHTDKGGRSFNFANVLGAFTSGAISNLYYPGKTLIRIIPATATTPARPVYENDRGVELTLSRASLALGYGMAGGLFDEFWPDIQHKLFHKHQGAGPNPAP